MSILVVVLRRESPGSVLTRSILLGFPAVGSSSLNAWQRRSIVVHRSSVKKLSALECEWMVSRATSRCLCILQPVSASAATWCSR